MLSPRLASWEVLDDGDIAGLLGPLVLRLEAQCLTLCTALSKLLGDIISFAESNAEEKNPLDVARIHSHKCSVFKEYLTHIP